MCGSPWEQMDPPAAEWGMGEGGLPRDGTLLVNHAASSHPFSCIHWTVSQQEETDEKGKQAGWKNER